MHIVHSHSLGEISFTNLMPPIVSWQS